MWLDSTAVSIFVDLLVGLTYIFTNICRYIGWIDLYIYKYLYIYQLD